MEEIATLKCESSAGASMGAPATSVIERRERKSKQRFKELRDEERQ
jgi:hypothetical protein